MKSFIQENIIKIIIPDLLNKLIILKVNKIINKNVLN